MNKNILKSICDNKKDIIRKEFLDDIYLANVNTSYFFNDIELYTKCYIGYSEIEVYIDTFLNDTSLFIELCKYLYDNNSKMKSLLIENNITIYDILHNNEKFKYVYDLIKDNLCDINLKDFDIILNSYVCDDYIVSIVKITNLKDWSN